MVFFLQFSVVNFLAVNFLFLFCRFQFSVEKQKDVTILTYRNMKNLQLNLFALDIMVGPFGLCAKVALLIPRSIRSYTFLSTI